MIKATAIVMLAVLCGCSASSPKSSRGQAQGGGPGTLDDGTSGSAGSGSFGNGNAGSATTSDGEPTGGSANDCGGETFQGEVKSRLDIFVVFDLSGSMFIPNAGGGGGACYGGFGPGCTTGGTGAGGPSNIYDSVSAAVRSFVNAPESSGIGIAVRGYNDECSVDTMAMPNVPMETLPMNAMPVTAWLDQNATNMDYGGTETVPALQGGVKFMRDWLGTHPDSKGVVLLVTDGEPDDNCAGNDVPAAAADALAGSPSIPTYVLGLGNIASLNAVAAAGGTKQAFVVSDPTASGTAIGDQLNAIRGDAKPLPCEFLVPTGGEKTPDLVNMDFTPSAAPMKTTIPRVPDMAACGAKGGWYYDDPASPHTMITCDATCSQLSGGGGRVDIALGCPTVVLE